MFKLKQKISKTELGLSVILLAQLILLIIFNLTKLAAVADFDSSAAMAQAMEIHRQKTLFISDWIYQSTLGLDSLLPLAAVLYGLTHNIFMAYGIANCIGTLFFLYIIISTADLFNIKRTSSLCSCILILTPFSIAMLGYFPMMFVNASYYMMKALLPVILISVIIRIQKNKFRPGHCILVIILLWLSFFTGFSCSLYLMMCGFIPVLAAQLINICTEKFYNKNNVKQMFISFIPSILACIMCMAGMLSVKYYYPNTFTSEMILCTSSNFFDNFFRFIMGFFELFGAVAYEDTKVLSYDGIFILLHLCLAIIYIIFVGAGIKKLKKNINNNDFLYFFMVIIINFIILILTYTTYGSGTYEYRYFLIPFVSGIFLFCYGADSLLANIKVHATNILTLICAVFILLVSVLSYNYYNKIDYGNDDLKKLSQSLIQHDVSVAYFIDTTNKSEIDARVLRLFSDSVNIVYGNKYGEFKDWGTSSKYFDTEYIENTDSAIISTSDSKPDTPDIYNYSYSVGDYKVYTIKK